MSLNLKNHMADLSHFNFRPENHGEDKVSAIDLKLIILTSPDVLKRFEPTMANFLFANANVRIPEMLPIGIDTDIEHCAINLAGIEINDVKLRKFWFTPQIDAAGNKQIKMQVTATFYPDGKVDINKIGEHLGKQVTIDIDPQELH
jgi:hypothetical protein